MSTRTRLTTNEQKANRLALRIAAANPDAVTLVIDDGLLKPVMRNSQDISKSEKNDPRNDFRESAAPSLCEVR